MQKAKEKRDDIWLNSELGFCLNRLGKYEEASVYLEKAIELGRNDEWAYSETGFSLKKMDRYEEALNYYLKSEEAGRNDDWLNVEIAECLGEVGKIEEAITRLKKTLTLKDCEKDLINSQIGYLYGKNNNSKEALNYLYEAQKLGRDDIWLNSEIGWDLVNIADDSSQKLEDSSKTYEEALKYLNKAVELGRDDEWIHGQLGYTLSKMGRYKDAILHFEKVRFIDPNDMWILYHLGIALRKAGEIQKAIEVLESSLEKTKYRGWVELELAWCYALIEDREKAQKYLDEAESYIGGEKENSLDVKKDFEW